MKEYIEREAAVKRFTFATLDCLGMEPQIRASDAVKAIETIPAADVVEVKLLDDGTLVVTTDKYPHVNRVFVEDGKTSGSLFYAEEE